MKSIRNPFVVLFLMFLSALSFADKISIQGEPVALPKNGDVYFIPNTYTTSSDYNYVTYGNSKKVCYRKAQPQLSALNVEVINVNIRGFETQWTCYNYDQTYFTVTP